ncbi:MAG: hypothetical protein QME52_03235 [Bacteroidota bacterium]|nr:hypothetical protein [Bacteroidota bacterium]
MRYLLVTHKVADFTKWKRIFDADAEAQRKAGLHLLHLLRDTVDLNLVVLLFRVDDLNKAKAFTQNPDASDHGEMSSVIGAPKILWLSG